MSDLVCTLREMLYPRIRIMVQLIESLELKVKMLRSGYPYLPRNEHLGNKLILSVTYQKMFWSWLEAEACSGACNLPARTVIEMYSTLRGTFSFLTANLRMTV